MTRSRAAWIKSYPEMTRSCASWVKSRQEMTRSRASWMKSRQEMARSHASWRLMSLAAERFTLMSLCGLDPDHDLTLSPGTIYILGTRALYPNVVVWPRSRVLFNPKPWHDLYTCTRALYPNVVVCHKSRARFNPKPCHDLYPWHPSALP